MCHTNTHISCSTGSEAASLQTISVRMKKDECPLFFLFLHSSLWVPPSNDIARKSKLLAGSGPRDQIGVSVLSSSSRSRSSAKIDQTSDRDRETCAPRGRTLGVHGLHFSPFTDPLPLLPHNYVDPQKKGHDDVFAMWREGCLAGDLQHINQFHTAHVPTPFHTQ